VIPLLFVLLILFDGVLVYRQSHLVGLPLIDEPFEPLPFDKAAFASPKNASPDYEAAEKVYVEQREPKVIGNEPRNAFDGALHEILVDLELHCALTDGWSAATDAVQRYVDLNRESLEHYRRGAAKPRYVRAPGWDVERRVAPRTIYLVARCDLVRSGRVERDGDLVAAWESREAALRASRHLLDVDESGGQYGSLSSDVLNSLPRWARDDRVGTSLLRRALRAVDAAETPREPPSVALRRRYWDSLRSFESFDARWIEEWIHHDRSSKAVFVGDFLENEPEVSRRCVRLAVENILPFVDRPLWEQPPIAPAVAPAARGASPWEPVEKRHRAEPADIRLFEREPGTAPAPSLAPADLAERIRDSRYAGNAIQRFDLATWLRPLRSDETRFLLMRALLCAEIVRRETGRYPARIEDLVRDDLLQEVPRDPWSPTGAPLRYRVDDDGHVTIWSLGPDLIDDGGEVWKIVHPPPWPLDLGTTSRPRPVDAPPLG
jgi:hypothetical protein